MLGGIGGQQRAKSRIAIDTGERSPDEARRAVDEHGDLTVADESQVKIAHVALLDVD
jgi:hypothetical protein